VDPAWKIVLVNAQTDKKFEYSREDLVGQPLERVVPGPSRERRAAHRAAFHREPRAHPMGAGLELFARRKNARQFPVEISLYSVEFCCINLYTAQSRSISEPNPSENARRRLPKNNLILSETHHRVKGNLQVVSSLLNLHGGLDSRLVKVLMRQLDGELRARGPGEPKFKIVFSGEA
jgi:hypothetical protein